ncbi:restriction endonuclease subunit S [Candidatus Arthromitus sp. SFB-turkey]|uniref:restriction endonuclease subunit S n=1 Tax=Candidatus Arthromitus sp. SFB-turkey TaxID=1840217 RepID=UPI0007F3E7F0|nr:restriction endonuclease subunit S [Candidatus Arthromitus sp. SFB-turkey]OAT88242.1 hypothetical protein A6P36_00105 [Candidatus Arthromitus sp. SFB-turkey]
MGEWKNFKLSELGEVIGGSTPSTKREEYYGGNIAWITPKDLSGYQYRFISKGSRNISEEGLNSCSLKMLPKNSILFTSRAPIGYVAIAENDLCTNQGFKSIIPNENVDYMFMYYLMKYNKEIIEAMGSGTTFKEVSGTVMKNVYVKIPIDKKEQQKISKILSSLDEKIEINRKINENLEEQAKEIFKRWFVDYEFPNEEGQPYKSSGGEMIESELGLIPKGWEVKKLESIINISNGRRPKNKIKLKNRQYCIPIIGSSCITGYTDEFLYDEHVLVIGRVGTHGIVQRFKEKIWVSDNAMVIKSNYYEYTNQILNNICYENLNVGSTQPLITQSDIKKHLIKVPINRLINSFEKIVSSLYEKYYFNECEIQKLYSLRDTLLPKLMTGEIDVSKIDI